jgi:RNA polymerase sigma factor (sigma-70 family)
MTDDERLKTLKLLHEQNWGEIGEKLVAYAEWKALEKYWRRGAEGHLALGISAEDIVQEAIRRAFEDIRKWNPQEHELLPWLKRVVDSLMYHLCVSNGHQREIFIPQTDEGEELTEVVVQTASLDQVTPIQTPDPEDSLLTKEKIDYNVGILLDAIAGDPELEKMYETAVDIGEFNQQSVAEELGVSIEQVYSWTRKLRRRVAKLMMKTREEHDQAKANSNQ